MTYHWNGKELKFTEEPRHPLMKRLVRRNLNPVSMGLVLGLAILSTWLTHENWGWDFLITYFVLYSGMFVGSLAREAYKWSKR
jgi:hypothetical protein